MARHLAATDARVNFGDVLRGVSERRETVVVERGRTPLTVVISIAEYQRLTRDARVVPDVVTMLKDLHELIRREGNQLLFLPPEEVIRQGREVRHAQNWESLR